MGYFATIACLLCYARKTVLLYPRSILLCHQRCAAGLFFMNLVVDASFIVDMALQPFQSYWDEHHDMCGLNFAITLCCYNGYRTLTPALSSGHRRNFRSHVMMRSWVMDLAAIRRRYVRTWATVDVVAATPYDVLAVLVGDHWIGRLQA